MFPARKVFPYPYPTSPLLYPNSPAGGQWAGMSPERVSWDAFVKEHFNPLDPPRHSLNYKCFEGEKILGDVSFLHT
jgi:hypothetical protein